jgi:hypothetical protein
MITALGIGAASVASLAGTGCYRYTPIESSTPALGTEVRLELTDAGAVTLGPLVGNRVELVDGRVITVADTALTLSVTGTTDRVGTETSWRGEQVVFPRSALASVHRRTLDRRRSYIAGGIAAGLVAVAGVGFSLNGGGGGNHGGGTGSPK